jgi:hypothetical protein
MAPTPSTAPSIGRIVHYHLTPDLSDKPAGEFTTRAAIITATDSFAALLTVFGPDGPYTAPDVPFAETPQVGHWSWPPRV